MNKSLLKMVILLLSVNLPAENNSLNYLRTKLSLIQQFFVNKEAIVTTEASVEALVPRTLSVGFLEISGEIQDFKQHFFILKEYSDNNNIDCILISIDSEGGSCGDAEILAAYIYELKKIKPIIAFVRRSCLSAAYWIASACSTIVAAESSTIGHIGTISVFGNKDNLIFIASGDYKCPQFVNNNTDISKEFKEYIQHYINDLAETFFTKTSLYRNLNSEFLRNLQGKYFTGSQALPLGLIDQTGTFSDLIRSINKRMSEQNKSTYHSLTLINPENQKIATFTL